MNMPWSNHPSRNRSGHAADFPWGSDGIIREELFSAERLEQHAASLAAAQRTTARPGGGRLLYRRLGQNKARLLDAYGTFSAAISKGQSVTPAAEWLVDNYHQVEAQIRQIHEDLPPAYYRRLPNLADGPFAGYPRVFGIAWACIAHSDSHFDVESLRRFLLAYQKVEVLTIGELWAVAITMRIVLIENLRRAVDRIIESQEGLEEANAIADQLLGTGSGMADPDVLISRQAAGHGCSPALIVQLVKRLRDQDPRVTPAMRWLEEQMASRGSNADQMVHEEHQRQGASNVTVRNIIISMRLISDIDWAEVCESVSAVDRVMRSGSAFDGMDFATRDLYRNAIEELSRGSRHSELEVAAAAMDRAQRADVQSCREKDPGFYLIDGGRRAFERELKYRIPLRHWPSRLHPSLCNAAYFLAVAVVTATALALPLITLAQQSVATGSLLLLGLLGFIPAIDAGLAIINWAVTRGSATSTLPALDLKDGVPASLRSMVVVPSMLTSVESIDTLVQRLEVHYLASMPGELYFALLTDWTDATLAHAPGDEALLAAASAGIARLNLRYPGSDHRPRFYLLHRDRRWSEVQRRWMGWERKRGKLHELNRLLRGATDTSFVSLDGKAPALPEGIRFVVTLDSDTRLPRDAVRRLIGKMAHPLNEPRYDESGRRVVGGYALLQPRVTPSLPVGREGSLFQRVFSGVTGINAYDSAAADVYQDLFGAGSYAGKGIYDVDAFETVLANRVPEASLLSHDLFEGTFARSGLASDIEVVEEFPSDYAVAAARNHRWARGDWQLLPWIFGRGDRHGSGRDRLPLLGTWKMLDNLRRTLSAPSCIAALLAGWMLALPAALAWTLFVVATIALPPLLQVFAALLPPRRGVAHRSHLVALVADCRLALLQITLAVSFLAHQAWLMLDAIVRTLYRLWVSHHDLLEWVTAAQSQSQLRVGLSQRYRSMAGSVVLSLLAALLLAMTHAPALWLAAPFLLLWMLSPVIAAYISTSPLVAGRVARTQADDAELRRVARRTWRYFETYVTAEDNMLPPDNFQQDPKPAVAHRTSPTNLGLYLISVASAHDFGWIGMLDAIDRLEATLASMQRLPLCRGHFYNWYETRHLQPLEPRYVSTVDSGNLAAHLITLACTCSEWRQLTANYAVNSAGIGDCLSLARLQLARSNHIADSPRRQRLDEALGTMSDVLQQPALHAGDIAAWLLAATECVSAVQAAMQALARAEPEANLGELQYWVDATAQSVASTHRDTETDNAAQASTAMRLAELEETLRSMAMAMEFDFLFDRERRLLSIGYLADEGVLDPNCYDLLASEARLASFFAIAKNDVPTRHWFRLGRPVTAIDNGAGLISWSGSMFEYLMPSLVMRAPTGSLLEQSSRLIVRRQIAYAEALQIPWGVSESAYNARDLEMTYQYSNFGVPGLGLKRGLGRNTVIAPYATALAAMVDPHAAVLNFLRLDLIGACGECGFFEAVDYTAARLPKGSTFAIVKSYMAHHQGMTIVAIANVLFDGRMRARFHRDPRVQATELLLQERTPRDLAISPPHAEEIRPATPQAVAGVDLDRQLFSTETATVQTQLLCNSDYALMISSSGAGYSQWLGIALTRWREDPTRDIDGQYVFLRDLQTHAVWSAGYQPSCVRPDAYHVTFTEDRAVFERRDGTLRTRLRVMVSPEDDAELRSITIINTGNRDRDIDVSSYSELVLAPAASDLAQTAFSKLFVQTEYVPRYGALIATRRRRDPEEPEVWAGQQMIVEGRELQPQQYETDRARFLGRGGSVRAPAAVHTAEPLSNSVGTVLDPVFVLRSRVRIPPGGTVRLSCWTVAASTRQRVCELLDKHHDLSSEQRVETLAWIHAQAQLLHLGISHDQANLFQRLAGHVLYTSQALRPSADAIERGVGPRDALWAEGISGDRPIVVLRIEHREDLAVLRQILQAHEYLRLKHLFMDLVIINDRATSYVQDLQTDIDTAVRTSHTRLHLGVQEARSSIFTLRADLISEQTLGVLSAVARVVIVADRGSLAAQLDRLVDHRRGTSKADTHSPPGRLALPPPPRGQAKAPPPTDLEFFNGLGGFGDEGREYLVQLQGDEVTPAPWINVIANASFGCQVSVEGGGYTWSLNSRENQLTPWSNDAVCDPIAEVLYIRDEATGEYWTPTRAPRCNPRGQYSVRHGHGYTIFEHVAEDLVLKLEIFVPLDSAVKVSRLRIRDTSGLQRRLSVTAYVDWVLGTSRSAGAPFLTTSIDEKTGALFARNPMNPMFGPRVAFIDLSGLQTEWSGDRREFLGRCRDLDRPAALEQDGRLSMHTGAGMDPCGALRTVIDVAGNGTAEAVLFLGQHEDAAGASAMVQECRRLDVDAALQSVRSHWRQTLGVVQVKTPDRALDIMLNGWLLYQTLACRTWARAAFYQASGAYGFRDQLQDAMALVTARPDITRSHLLRAAARQYPQGDVQHWWLPSTGQGVRTRISDDRIWLAYVAVYYVEHSGDLAILDEAVPFIDGPALAPGVHDSFTQPAVTELTASLFEHCARALDDSLALGAHGLPLIGSGDWNDGMNRVGAAGQGESVWLGWFLYATLMAFAPHARERDPARATRWLAHAATLRESLEKEGWDGAWYLRGYFDDGTPLGSAQSDECRIDSIAQSWSVLSGAASPERAAQAMAAVESELIRHDERLALLFTPAFDHTTHDPGYIKAYPPGLRENGGQYTHAATWSVFALAKLGQGEKAAALLALLNPVNLASSPVAMQRYKVEPYVVAADIYSVAPHAGRGGWTWYTGAAGWLYRAGVEAVLGFHQRGSSLELRPCIPEDWPRYDIVFNYRSARYAITVENPSAVNGGIAAVVIDGQTSAPGDHSITLADDGRTHEVLITLGADNTPMTEDLPPIGD
jgi:cyclic beta-1,2-glucan synthetase